MSSIPLEYEEDFKFNPHTANIFQSKLLFKFLLVVLEVESRVSCAVSECSTTKLYLQPTDIIIIIVIITISSYSGTSCFICGLDGLSFY